MLKKHEIELFEGSIKEYQNEFRDWKKQAILMVVISKCNNKKSILKNKCKNDSIEKSASARKFATQNLGPVWALYEFMSALNKFYVEAVVVC